MEKFGLYINLLCIIAAVFANNMLGLIPKKSESEDMP